MLKVLVVDDEFIVRTGLISCIQWEDMHLELIGEASNGEEALDIILNKTPDIILLDLLMPGMTGMELIEKLEELNIKTNIIILSCHEDYSYVRDAFKKGVRDYILKLSSTPEEICSVLRDVSGKILNERADASPVSVLTEVAELDGSYPPTELVSPDSYYFTVTFSGDFLTKDGRKQLKNLMLQWLEQTSCPSGRLIPCFINEEEYAFLYTCRTVLQTSEEAEKALYNMMKLFYKFLSGFVSTPVFIGISGPCSSRKTVKKALHESSKALNTLFYDNTRHTGLYSYLEKLYHNEEARSGTAFYGNIGEVVRHQRYQSLTDQINAYHLWVQKTKPDPRIVKLDSIDLINTLGNYLKEKKLTLADMSEDYLYFYQDIAQMRSFYELQSYLDSFVRTYICLLQSKGHKNIRNDVMEALQFIEEHYNDDISLTDVADYINISKNHLSYLFRKETGQTFSDYLVQYRIGKAKRLLESREKYTVSEIAEMTGFHDTGYFSKVFKKTTGLSPNQYKKGL